MQQLTIFDQSADTQERLELLEYILDNLEVEHFKGKFNKNKEYSLVRFKDEHIALYDVNTNDEAMFKKLVQVLEERKKR